MSRTSRRRCRTLLAAVLGILVTGSVLRAQVAGRIEGRVVDDATGDPLVGVQVFVQGTGRGNVSGDDGRYFVNDVPAGDHRVEARRLGYRTVVVERRVFSDQTIAVDFALRSQAVEAEPLVATIEAEPLMPRDRVTSRNVHAGEEIRELPTDGIEEVVTLGPGVYASRGTVIAPDEGPIEDEGGLVIRGGRVTEAAVFVDGTPLSDFSRQVLSVGPGTYAVEEVDVIVGAFSAEYGHAQSGIVNFVTREPERDFEGSVRLTLDAHPGSDGYDTAERDSFERERCCGYRSLQVGIGGPIVPGRISFFVSGELVNAADFSPSAAGFNPALGEFNSSGSTETILPGNRGNRTHALLKLQARPTEGSRVTGSYLFSREQRERYDVQHGLDQFVSSAARRATVHDVILRWSQEVIRSASRDLRFDVTLTRQTTETASGTPRSPEMAAVLEAQLGDRCGAECDVRGDAFRPGALGFVFDDVEFFFEDSMPGTVGGTRGPVSEPPDPVFGIPRTWTTDGFDPSFEQRDERRVGIRIDVESQVSRALRLKAGVEWNRLELDVRGGNLTTTFGGEAYHAEPRIGAAYAQSRTDLGDLVLDAGVRWDRWDPNTEFPAVPGLVDCEVATLAIPRGGECREGIGTVPGVVRSELAPRLAVSHPLTDRTHVRLSYGRFYQLPQLRHVFQNVFSDVRIVDTFGNPKLDFVETTAFEFGVTRALGNDVSLDVVAYSRDRRGAVRLDLVPLRALHPQQPEMFVFGNGDNGNVRGVEFTLRRRFADWWSADASWSLQWARGTTSSPTAFVGRRRTLGLENPLEFLAPPTELAPEDFDQLHTIDAQISIAVPRGFRRGTLLGDLFARAGLTAVYRAASGRPFTRRDFDGVPLEDPGESRKPWIHAGDIRVWREFRLGGLDLRAFALVLNVLDLPNPVFVHPTAARPDRRGDEERRAAARVPFEFLVEGHEIEDFPYPVSVVQPEVRDRIARQDRNGDGLITRNEAQRASLEAFIARRSDLPTVYGSPRRTRLGIEVRF